ncbi:Ribosome production factor 1 [Entophlyctis sp. JEL0112]|nr:Ribosome production factor 1 [Entophlyctis sp. JEL0112]
MVDPNDIKNKMKRSEVVNNLRIEKNRLKLKRRMRTRKAEAENPELKEERLRANVPRTLESTREADDTIVEPDDEEVFASEDTDEFASYFNGTPPKILVTTSKRATGDTYDFAKEFCSIFPDAQFVKRGPQFQVKRIVELAIGREFTDVVIINENKKTPEFQGRQVATFHNQRDFIFFRRHRYIFKDGKKVDLQELGPRFTLKLKWLQKGTFDTKYGDYEWIYKPEMATSRRRFFL